MKQHRPAQILCTRFPDVLQRVIVSFCEANIDFAEKLELCGSLHIKADGQKLASFIIDEEIKTTKPAAAERPVPFSPLSALPTNQHEPPRNMEVGPNREYQPVDFVPLRNTDRMSQNTSPPLLNPIMDGPPLAAAGPHNPDTGSAEDATNVNLGGFTLSEMKQERQDDDVIDLSSNKSDETASPIEASPTRNDLGQGPFPMNIGMVYSTAGGPFAAGTVNPYPAAAVFPGHMPASVAPPTFSFPLYQSAMSLHQGHSMFPLPVDLIPKSRPKVMSAMTKGLLSKRKKNGGIINGLVSGGSMIRPLKRFGCPLCEATFANRQSLKNHINCQHTRINKYPCTICNKVFYSGGAVYLHLKRSHAGEKAPNTCSVCNKLFINMESYKRHVQVTHCLEVCETCGGLFSNKEILTQHRITSCPGSAASPKASANQASDKAPVPGPVLVNPKTEQVAQNSNTMNENI